MTIIRTFHNQENPYVQLHSESLRSKMSWTATGLFAFMFSFKNDWEFNMIDLAARKNETAHTTFAAMRELIQEGFAIRYQPTVRKDGKCSRGKICYIVFEQPLSIEERQKIVYSLSDQPYFPDISKPSAKLKLKNQIDAHGEELPKKYAYKACGPQCEIAHAQVAHALNQNLSINDKTSINKGNDINEQSLPFSISEEESLKKTKPIELKPPKATTAQAPVLTVQSHAEKQFEAAALRANLPNTTPAQTLFLKPPQEAIILLQTNSLKLLSGLRLKE